VNKIISLEAYRIKKYESDTITQATRYLEENDPNSNKLDVQLLVCLLSEAKRSNIDSFPFRPSQYSKYFDTSIYRVRKALNTLLDIGLIEVVEKTKGKPFVISVSNSYLAIRNLS
jgi:hypothetical protein